MRFMHVRAAALILFVFARLSSATVAVYENQADWQNAVNHHYTTIGFTGWPDWTIITNQYANLGIEFTDGTDRVRNNPNIFLNDGSGLYGAITSITMQFAAPIYYMAHWYLSTSKLELYLGGSLIYTSPTFDPPTPHHFVGFVSTQPFDRARIFSPVGAEINVDDLYFQPIPAPGALALLGLAALARHRRRPIA